MNLQTTLKVIEEIYSYKDQTKTKMGLDQATIDYFTQKYKIKAKVDQAALDLLTSIELFNSQDQDI